MSGNNGCLVFSISNFKLESGKVKYFGTDVYHVEPPTDSPLLKAENVLLTPHLGAQTYENMDRIGEIIVDLIKDFTLAIGDA